MAPANVVGRAGRAVDDSVRQRRSCRADCIHFVRSCCICCSYVRMCTGSLFCFCGGWDLPGQGGRRASCCWLLAALMLSSQTTAPTTTTPAAAHHHRSIVKLFWRAACRRAGGRTAADVEQIPSYFMPSVSVVLQLTMLLLLRPPARCPSLKESEA